MAQNISLYGTTRVIPETPETGWGTEMTTDILDMIRGLGLTWLISNVPVLALTSTNNLSLAAGSTITQATPIHIVSGNGAITLNGTTAITAGVTNGQLLVLIGDSTITTNTVSITDGSKVKLNGNIIIGALTVLALWWNTTNGNWWEFWRNN